MKTLLGTLTGLCVAAILSAQEKGAKALFIDTTSGAAFQSSAATPVSRSTKPAAVKPSRARASTPAPEVSGLMYYLELVSPTGETSRVTTDRTFTSGERILLHVVSAVDGEIAIYQRTPSGQAARLFPDQRIRNGDARISKAVDTVLPSPTSWFRFDDRPGTEELTIILTPRSGSTPPPRSPSPLQTVSTSYDDIASASGAKGLVVETDHDSPAPATYVVRRAVSGGQPEPIVVTVRLVHK